MSKSLSAADRDANGVFGRWFAEHYDFAYAVARRKIRRLLAMSGRSASPDQLDEYVQDALCRAFEKFARNCSKSLPLRAERRAWVIKATRQACHEVVRSRASWGNPSEPVAIRDDAMTRWHRVRPDGRHGTDMERHDLDPTYEPRPDRVIVEGEEDALLEQLPLALRETAAMAMAGLHQDQIAVLKHCSVRTVQGQYKAIREYLAPDADVYARIAAYIESALTWRAWTIQPDSLPISPPETVETPEPVCTPAWHTEPALSRGYSHPLSVQAWLFRADYCPRFAKPWTAEYIRLQSALANPPPKVAFCG